MIFQRIASSLFLLYLILGHVKLFFKFYSFLFQHFQLLFRFGKADWQYFGILWRFNQFWWYGKSFFSWLVTKLYDLCCQSLLPKLFFFGQALLNFLQTWLKLFVENFLAMNNCGLTIKFSWKMLIFSLKFMGYSFELIERGV